MNARCRESSTEAFRVWTWCCRQDGKKAMERPSTLYRVGRLCLLLFLYCRCFPPILRTPSPANNHHRKETVVRFAAKPQPLEYLPREDHSSSTLKSNSPSSAVTGREFSFSSWRKQDLEGTTTSNYRGNNSHEQSDGIEEQSTRHAHFSSAYRHAADAPSKPDGEPVVSLSRMIEATPSI